MKFEQKDFEFLPGMIQESIKNYFDKKEHKEFEKQTFNITETCKIINRSYNYVKDLITDGYLKTTSDGKFISGKEINRYLGEQNKNAVSTDKIETA